MEIALGVDIGGTTLKAGRVGPTGLEARVSAQTPQEPRSLVESVTALVEELQGPKKSIGVAVAGLLSPHDGAIINSPNLRWLEGFPLRDSLQKALGCQVHLVNDATAAALGENSFGAGKDHVNFLLATLGTGIGGGIALNGKIWEGPGGMAGEFGHTRSGHQRVCGCGTVGCVEAVASASAMETASQEAGLHLGLKELAETARQGNADALRIFQNAGTALGNAFGQVALLLDLRVLVLGGGGSPCTDLLADSIREEAGRRAFGRTAEDFTVVESPLGNEAGILGAACRGQEKQSY